MFENAGRWREEQIAAGRLDFAGDGELWNTFCDEKEIAGPLLLFTASSKSDVPGDSRTWSALPKLLLFALSGLLCWAEKEEGTKVTV